MHFQKYGINQITKLFEHYTREHITENVVQDRIKNNQYYFNANAKNYIDNFDKKVEHKKSNALSEYCGIQINNRTTRRLRADSVVMIDLIITQPEYLGKELDQKFFDTMQDTLKKKYIKDNNFIMSAIHQDEQGQPHMHYSFIPIVEDKKKNKEKLCAKEFLTKDFLKDFHKQMEKETGYTLTSEDKTIKNLSMEQYQNKKEIERQQENIKEQEKIIKENENKIINNTNTISEQEKKLDNKLKEKEEKLKEYNDTIDSYDRQYNSYGRIELKKPEELKRITFQPKDTVLFNVNDYNNLLQQVRDLEFATTNDYNKRMRLKDQYDKEIYQQEKYLSEIKNNDFTSLKNEIKSREYRIKELNQEINSKDIELRASKTLLDKAEQKSKNMYNSWLLEKNENDAIKSVLEDNNILDKVMNLVNKILHHDNCYTR